MPLQEIVQYARNVVDQWARDSATMEALRVLIIEGTAPFMTCLLLLTVAASILALPSAWRAARRISFGAWSAALVTLNLALALRSTWTPHLPQVYFDELLFLNTSETLARHGLHALTLPGNAFPGQAFHACPAAWQYCIALAYRGLGVTTPEAAFALATVLSGLSVLAIFLAVHAMFDNERAAVLAAIFLAVLPVHVRLAGSSALETASLFFLLVALAGLASWMRSGDRPLLWVASCATAWFLNVRMENAVAIFPLVFVFLLVACPSERVRGWRNVTDLLVAGTIVIVGALPAVLADFYGLAAHTYYFYQASEVTEAHIRSNVLGNFTYWVTDRIHPLPFTILAVVGLLASRRDDRRLAWFWAAWFGALVVFYTLNPSCDFSLRHTIDSWRNALHPALGLLILAALGADALLRAIPVPPLRVAATAMVVLTVVTIPLLFRDFVQDRHLWMWGWRAQSTMRDRLPADAWLLVPDREMAYGPYGLSLTYELACTTGRLPRYFYFPSEPPATADSPRPEIVRQVAHWTALEKQSLYLFFLHMGTVEDDRVLALMHRAFRLEPVAGQSVRRHHVSFSLWRVQGTR